MSLTFKKKKKTTLTNAVAENGRGLHNSVFQFFISNQATLKYSF